ncbi:MAG: HAMP domain-containing histidine kinase [Myxococcota bacterium]|nr:HAMP domain-containing histidine kinase [Myxococcota bacterium]
METDSGAEWFLEFLPVAAIWTRNGETVDCNEAAVRLLGVPRSAQTLDAWSTSFNPPVLAGVESFVEHIRDALAGRNVPRTHVRLQRGPHEFTGLFVQSYPALFPDGQLGAVALFEEASRLEDDQRRMDVWLGALAHELSGTVQSMAMNIELLKRGCPDDDGASWKRLESLERNSKVLRRLVTDYIDAARAEEGNLRCRPEAIPLDPLLARLREAQQTTDPDHHIEVTGQTGLVGYGDETWVVQILRNLLTNAQKYSDPGIIELATELRGHQIAIRLRDEGPGIPSDQQGQLFARFSRLPSAREGSGLGLWLSRYLARRMGGDLWLESDGAHSTFVLAMPRHLNLEREQPLREPEGERTHL